MNRPIVAPTDFDDFDIDLFDLEYTLRCLHVECSRTSARRDKEAIFKKAQMEVANMPWLRSSLPEWLRVFSRSPECQSPFSDPFLGSCLAFEGPRSLQTTSKKRKVRKPARTPVLPHTAMDPCSSTGPHSHVSVLHYLAHTAMVAASVPVPAAMVPAPVLVPAAMFPCSSIVPSNRVLIICCTLDS